ncbi:MAG TPA: hypothetical protein VHO46_03885 [Bacteroidales bacterium]|nr:hypothetical protein [Bacteroidales bacterium]
MGNDSNKKSLKITVFILAGLITAFLVYYAVISVISPVRKMENIEQEFAGNDDKKEESGAKIYSDSTYISLVRERSYLQSKTIMAQTDSIYLTLNLPDSTADLEISGVVVHSAKISSYNISGILKNGNPKAIYSMLSQPLNVENSYATIRKEPLMIKIAPKDTSEYQPDVIPDTALFEHVNVMLQVSHGMRIYIYQEESDKPTEKGSTFRFDLTDRINTAWLTFKSALFFKVPDYYPYLKIRMPRDDVKIIYRALPRSGQIAVNI